MILIGDAREQLRTLRRGSVQCVVTSPPYWGLRDYRITPVVWAGDDDCSHEWGETISVNATNHTDKRRWQHTRNGRDEQQPKEKRVAWLRTRVTQGNACQSCGAWRGSLGLEPTPEQYVSHLVDVFRAVRRVLREDGTVWLNLGDSYVGGGRGGNPNDAPFRKQATNAGSLVARSPMPEGLKPKDLVGIPWRVAFALQADGWYLRSDIVWAKAHEFCTGGVGSAMPESVRDRPTRAHEYLFLLTASPRYFYDYEAGLQPGVFAAGTRAAKGSGTREGNRRGTPPKAIRRLDRDQIGPPSQMRSIVSETGDRYMSGRAHARDGKRNLRDVWFISPRPYTGAHFATFPPALVEHCLRLGSREGDTVLDPFAGSGTVGQVARAMGRRFVLIDANPAYRKLMRQRIYGIGL